MSELGLNEQHAGLVCKFLEFARYQRKQNLNSIESLFQDVLDTRLLESTYTAEEVAEVLGGLRSVVVGETRAGLASCAHAQALLLQQFCTQAQRWHLKLEANMSELENRSLLECVQRLDDSEASGHASAKEISKPAQADDQGPTALLHREIKRLSTIAAEQRDAMNDLEERIAIECSKRKSAEKCVEEVTRQAEQYKQQLDKFQHELHSDLNTDVQLSKETTNSEDLNDKTEEIENCEKQRLREQLEEALARLTLTEQELQRKVNETSAFINMRRMLDAKNKQLRKLRSQFPPADDESSQEINDEDEDS